MSCSCNVLFRLVSTPSSELFQGTIKSDIGASLLPRTDIPRTILASGSPDPLEPLSSATAKATENRIKQRLINFRHMVSSLERRSTPCLVHRQSALHAG